MVFSKIKKHIDELNQDIRAYVNAKFEYFELMLLKKVTETLANVIKGILAGVFFLFFLVMLSAAVAIYIGQRMGDMSLGFFIVAGFYLLVILFILIFGKKLFASKLIRVLSKKMAKKKKSNS